MRRVLILLRRAFFNSWLDGCFGVAKGAAYSGLLALFPVLSTLAAILVQANAGKVSEYLARFAFEVVPPGTADIIERLFRERGSQPLSLLIGATAVSAWAASSWMASLMEGFRAAYRLPGGRGMVQDRLVAIALVFISALPAIGASTLLVAGDRIERTLLSLTPSFALAIRLVRFGVAFGATIVTTVLLYYIAPNRPQKWRYVWPGAVVAAVLWLLVTLAFGWYVRNLANYNVMYGSVGGVVALIVWMYLLAAIALYGCEYNAENERVKRSK